jgi:AcrR family transcriptional regulator
MAPRGRKKRKTYHHGDLRAAILEAAVEVIRERGLVGLSLRECARRVGVSHAAPYRHFADKDALLMALAGEGFRELYEAGLEAMADLKEPRARLDAYGVAYVRFAIARPEHFRIMFASELDADAGTDEDRAASDAAFNLLDACSAALVPAEEVEAASVSYWSLVHGLSMLILDGRIPEEHLGSDAAVEALTRQMFARWRET